MRVQIGGSLAKLVYFTRLPEPPSSPSIAATRGSSTPSEISDFGSASSTDDYSPPYTPQLRMQKNGTLTPLLLDQNHSMPSLSTTMESELIPNGHFQSALDDHHILTSMMRQTTRHFPGGSLNFERFETENIQECVDFIQSLIERSAKANAVSIEEMRRGVKIMATGGGAHKFHDLFTNTLGVEVIREDEMECLIEGLKFFTLIPDEVYYFSDELIHSIQSSSVDVPPLPTHDVNAGFERPSPDPPKYAVTFQVTPTPQLPCLLVNIGSGVSIIRVDEDGGFERVSGTSLGGGTLWGLLSLLTPATSFDGPSHDVLNWTHPDWSHRNVGIFR